MDEIPFFSRLSTRLTLLILVVVGVLAGATAIMVIRGFNLAQQGALELLQGGDFSELQPEEAADLSAIVRATLINLVAVFLFTLVGAAVFSRSLLTEPIANLVRGTRELASGKLGTTLPVTSKNELGLLAGDFNQMSLALLEARDHLEQRVAERTVELRALLELSNSTALTHELHPLLNQILDRLEDAVGFKAAAIFEGHGSELQPLASRGGPSLDDQVAREVLDHRAPVLRGGDRDRLILPLIAREAVLGVMTLEHRPGHFEQSRLNLAMAFANQVAVALENTRAADPRPGAGGLRGAAAPGAGAARLGIAGALRHPARHPRRPETAGHLPGAEQGGTPVRRGAGAGRDRRDAGADLRTAPRIA